jgi:hypothetical protein
VLLAYPQMEERLIIKVQFNCVRPVIHSKEALTKMWIGEGKWEEIKNYKDIKWVIWDFIIRAALKSESEVLYKGA